MKASVDRLIEVTGLPEAAAQCRVAAIPFTYRCTIEELVKSMNLASEAGASPHFTVVFTVVFPEEKRDGLAETPDYGRG